MPEGGQQQQGRSDDEGSDRDIQADRAELLEQSPHRRQNIGEGGHHQRTPVYDESDRPEHAIAEFERAMIVERTKAGMARARARGASDEIL